MKKWTWIFVPFLLLGAGCFNTSPVTNEVPAPGTIDVDETVVEGDDSGAAGGTVEAGTPGAGDFDDTANGNEGEGIDISIDPEAAVFTIDSFMFGYSDTELRVKEGQTVTINLTSSGGMHDFVIDELDVATTRITTGGSTSVTFVADQKGTFEFYCSVMQHRANGMVGTFIVE